MIKTLTNLRKQEKEKFVVPKGVQDVIPITAIYDDGIFRWERTNFPRPINFQILTMPLPAVRIKNRCSLNTQSCLIPLIPAQ